MPADDNVIYLPKMRTAETDQCYQRRLAALREGYRRMKLPPLPPRETTADRSHLTPIDGTGDAA